MRKVKGLEQKDNKKIRERPFLTEKEYKKVLKENRRYIEPRRIVLAEFWLGTICLIGSLSITFMLSFFDGMWYLVLLILASFYYYAGKNIHYFMIYGPPKYLGRLTVMDECEDGLKERPLKDDEIDEFIENIDKYTENPEERESFINELRKTKRKRRQRHTFKEIVIYMLCGLVLIIGCYKFSKYVSTIIYAIINIPILLLYSAILIVILLLLIALTFIAYNAIKKNVLRLENDKIYD